MKNKLINKLKLGLAGIVLSATLNQCALPHLIALKKYNPISTEQKDSLFKDVNPGLKENIKKVYILDEKDFGINDVGGHMHKKDGTLCLPKKYFKDAIFHEPAHIKHFSLDKNGSDFSKKWKQTADFKYGTRNIKKIWNFWPFSIKDLAWKDKIKGPKKGVLTPYSSTDIYEDVADFVECLSYDFDPKERGKIDSNRINNLKEEIFKQKSEIDSYAKEKNLLLSKKPLSSIDSSLLKICSLMIDLSHNSIRYNSSMIENEKRKPLEWTEINKDYYPLFFADTSDYRYQKKLDLLLKYNFFTKQEHEKLSENLGSLNYLLKQGRKNENSK